MGKQYRSDLTAEKSSCFFNLRKSKKVISAFSKLKDLAVFEFANTSLYWSRLLKTLFFNSLLIIAATVLYDALNNL